MPVPRDNLNAALNSVKHVFPDDMVVTLVGMRQDQKTYELEVDFATSGDAIGVAQAIKVWADGILSGAIKIEHHPHGGKVH